MTSFFTIIKLDYLQRTRNYNFLIILCASLAIAYTFVPEPNANYSTIRISDYVGYYNSAWFGYVTTIMTSIFLSLIGFYLINSGIRNDLDTKVGLLIAASPIKNFKYLFAKFLSNFLLLFTIVCIIFLMSITLFFLYNDGYTFEIFQFIKPYAIITIPAMFFIASISILFEVLFSKYSVLQNIVFFFLFCFLLVNKPKSELEFSLDAFGSKIVMNKLEKKVRKITKSDKTTSMNIGYVLGHTNKAKKFEFTGVDFSPMFIASRFLWIFFSLTLIGFSSSIFHRFTIKKRQKIKPSKKINNKLIDDLNTSELVKVSTNFSVLPLIKTEILLLFRKGKKWLWLLNIFGMVLLAILPLTQAHLIVLPILWFLQVHRISDIATREKTYKIHLFTNSSYKPIKRIFTSKIIASFLLLLFLSSPLLIKYCLSFQFLKIGFISSGVLLLIVTSIIFGQVTKGKKLFEVTFFLITYANINKIPFLDYFGAFTNSFAEFYSVGLLIILFLILSIILKKKSLE